MGEAQSFADCRELFLAASNLDSSYKFALWCPKGCLSTPVAMHGFCQWQTDVETTSSGEEVHVFRGAEGCISGAQPFQSCVGFQRSTSQWEIMLIVVLVLNALSLVLLFPLACLLVHRRNKNAEASEP